MNNFRTHYALYGHLQHQRSTYMGPESPKSIHKFLLPENAFIIDFSDVEMPLRCPKVELRGQKPQNFDLKLGIKFWKELQTPWFLVKYCVLISSSLLFTQNMHTCFFFSSIFDFMSKNGHFFKIFPFFGLFSPRWGVKKIFSVKNGWNVFWPCFYP